MHELVEARRERRRWPFACVVRCAAVAALLLVGAGPEGKRDTGLFASALSAALGEAKRGPTRTVFE